MTIQERAEQFAEVNHDPTIFEDKEHVTAAYLAGYNEAAKWIEVTPETMPELETNNEKHYYPDMWQVSIRVIIWNGKGWNKARYSFSRNEWIGIEGTVTHYQLITPPKQ